MYKQVSSYIRKNPRFVVVLGVVFAVIALSLSSIAYLNRFTINPDGVAYISISQHYIDGKFMDAVNAYWAPLLSWLMVPFIAAGLEGMTAFAIVNLSACLFIVFFGGFLVFYTTKSKLATLLYIATSFPFAASILSGPITPDSLVVAWILMLLACLVKTSSIIQKPEKIPLKKSLYIGIAIGLLGVIGTFTKIFLQPVFFAGVVIFLFIEFLRLNNRKSRLKTIIVIGCISILSYIVFFAPWVVLQSQKYGYFMISSSYAYNSGLPKDHPMVRMLTEQPNKSSISTWEDPTYLIPYKYQSGQTLGKFERMMNSLPGYVANVSSLWVLLYATVVAACCLIVYQMRKRNEAINTTLLYAVVIFGIYFGGYSTTGVVLETLHRYFWPLLALAFVMVGLIVAYITNRLESCSNIRQRKAGWGAIILLVVSIPFSIASKYAWPVGQVTGSGAPDRIQRIALQLKAERSIPEFSKIAGSRFGDSLNIAYFMKLRHYGSFAIHEPFESMNTQRAVKNFDIDFFIDSCQPKNKTYGDNVKIVYTTGREAGCRGMPCLKTRSNCTFNILDIRRLKSSNVKTSHSQT